MRTLIAAILLLPPVVASAQDTSISPKECFSIMVPPPVGTNSPPGVAVLGMIGSILLNKCSGQTWFLVKVPNGEKGQSSFRWSPINATNGEAFFRD